MNFAQIPSGANPPQEINVVIEASRGSSSLVRYKTDPDTGTVWVHRILPIEQVYPCNYGFVPHSRVWNDDTLHVMVHTPHPLIAQSVIACRPIAVLQTQGDFGHSDRIFAVPLTEVDPSGQDIQELTDIPEIEKHRFQHFFQQHEGDEFDTHSYILGWDNRQEAESIVKRSIRAAKTHKENS